MDSEYKETFSVLTICIIALGIIVWIAIQMGM